MLAIVCPGQGSQTPGFLAPWLELPGARERAGELAELTGVDLITHGTVSDADTIKDTAVAQPLIVGAGLLVLDALLGTLTGGDRTALAGLGAISGHSVGEITAAAAAGVLDDADALRFVSLRGRGMAAASALTPTGMSAVLGGDPQDVLDALARHDLSPANMNGAGQVVAAGALDALAALRAEPPAKAKVIPLQVAGAFHTRYMAPAVEDLADLAVGLTVHDPVAPLLSNADGAPVASGREALDRLVAQVCNPVRWDLVMASMLERGVTAVVELAPAGTLTNLAKRAMPGVTTLAVKTPEDLDRARELLGEHAAGRS